MASYAEASLVSSMSFLADAQANVANNLANANTAGFKRSEAIAMAAKSGSLGSLDTDLPTVQFSQLLDWTPGILEPTKEKLNVALDDEGLSALIAKNPALKGNGNYFRVQKQDGAKFYTRRGDLQIDREGFLSTASGSARYLDDQDQPIQVGAVGELIIRPTGEIGSTDPGADSDISFGNLGVFMKEMKILEPIGSGLYRDPGNKSPTPSAASSIRQGSLERSNVEVVTELVKMIEVQRNFQAVSRALTSIGRLGSSFNTALNR